MSNLRPTAVGAGKPGAAQQTSNTSTDNFSLLELRDRVVIMLSFKQLVSVEKIEEAWRQWKESGEITSAESLWRVLAKDPELDKDQIYACAAEVYAFEEVEITQETYAFMQQHAETFSKEAWKMFADHHIVPIGQQNGSWYFATYDPTNNKVARILRGCGFKNYELRFISETDTFTAIKEGFPQFSKNEFLEKVEEGLDAFDLGTSYDAEKNGLIDEDALEAEIGRSSLINLFEAAILEAVRQGVSDIHIFPNPQRQIEIHFRVDGQLECWHVEKRVHAESFLAVVKDNAMNVDRFERDAAQDGFIQRVIDGTLIRFRVSVLPIANASQDVRSESIVIRVLDDRNVISDLSKLGLLESAMERFNWAITQPNGMVILTGPTGSGKTTTLFACLNQVVTPKVNVLTVEDPVEYIIPGVRQIKLSPKLDLEAAIRAILRHDPDIVMVGEMRDKATADLAIKLANTGHLTFSTLHTNDAPSAVSRLYKMGVEPFLIAYAINLVVAQRLIRRLCPSCKVPDSTQSEKILLSLGFTEEEIKTARLYRPGNKKDCQKCKGMGYKGRRAITETLAFSPEIRGLIVDAESNINEAAIKAQAKSEGMFTLQDSAREYVKLGETSIEELVRVVATD